MKDQIIDWLANNKPTINHLKYDVSQEALNMLQEEVDFREEILDQYRNRVKILVGEEISRQLGIQIDNIFEILEMPQVQEYLINDSLCLDASSIESPSK